MLENHKEGERKRQREVDFLTGNVDVSALFASFAYPKTKYENIRSCGITLRQWA